MTTESTLALSVLSSPRDKSRRTNTSRSFALFAFASTPTTVLSILEPLPRSSTWATSTLPRTTSHVRRAPGVLSLRARMMTKGLNALPRSSSDRSQLPLPLLRHQCRPRLLLHRLRRRPLPLPWSRHRHVAHCLGNPMRRSAKHHELDPRQDLQRESYRRAGHLYDADTGRRPTTSGAYSVLSVSRERSFNARTEQTALNLSPSSVSPPQHARRLRGRLQ